MIKIKKLIKNRNCKKIICLLSLIICIMFSKSLLAHSENSTLPDISQKNVLVVFSGSQLLPGNKLISSTLLETLEDGGIYPLNINIEYMDKQQNSNPKFLMQYRDFLINKYENTKIDLVITIDSFALFFFNKEGKDLFKNAPLISITVSEININDYKARNTLFLTSSYDLKGTIDQAIHMLPNTKRILVVNGNSYSEIVSENKIKPELLKNYGNMDIQFLSELSLEQIKKTVSSPLPNTIILFLTYFEDIDKNNYVPHKVASDLSKLASVPFFTLFEPMANSESIGGSMVSFQDEGLQAGKYALEVLRGNYNIVGGVSLPTKYVPIYNFQTLKRFGIDESLLPTATRLMFKNPSFFERHKALVISVVSIFGFLMFLILALIINIRKRRKVESEILNINNQLEAKVRKRAEDLQHSRAKYIELFTNMISAGIILNVKDEGNTFIIEDLNKAAESIEKINRYNFIGMDLKECIPNIPSDLLILLKQAWETGTPQHFSPILSLSTKSNGWRDNFYIFKLSQTQIAMMYDDVTEKMEQQEIINENRQIIREALELEKLRTEFFANISHEFKTPLNIILGVIQINELMFKNEGKSIDRKKTLNSITIQKQNCFRLLKLINNLIDVTKFDSKIFELNMTNCNIVSLVEEVTQSVADYIRTNDLTLVFDTNTEYRIIACDLDKIERILYNLLSNSIKYTDSGGSIFVNITDGEKYVTITVEDTGMGIEKEKLDMIFERFRRIDTSFTRKSEGSGLGLSIVKSLVEMHDGTISVESKYGEGTKFTISIPVKVLDYKNEENLDKLINNSITNRVERTKIEFSDIYGNFPA